MRFQQRHAWGLLSGEAPGLLGALEKLATNPDLLLCDGQGRSHGRSIEGKARRQAGLCFRSISRGQYIS
ncbi:MAG: endonuclease V [Burkholderiales bacterium]